MHAKLLRRSPPAARVWCFHCARPPATIAAAAGEMLGERTGRCQPTSTPIRTAGHRHTPHLPARSSSTSRSARVRARAMGQARCVPAMTGRWWGNGTWSLAVARGSRSCGTAGSLTAQAADAIAPARPPHRQRTLPARCLLAARPAATICQWQWRQVGRVKGAVQAVAAAAAPIVGLTREGRDRVSGRSSSSIHMVVTRMRVTWQLWQ